MKNNDNYNHFKNFNKIQFFYRKKNLIFIKKSYITSSHKK